MSSNTFILNGIDYQLLALPKQQKFGTIRFAQNSINTHKVVIKDISHPSQLHFLRNGGDKILCNINHPNLPKTESINWLSNEKAIIVREYFDGIDLKEIIATNNLYKKLSTATILSIFCQVLEALNYLHSLGVIHSDIKPSNILVNLDDASKPKVQLIDLEQAHLLDQTNHNYQKPFALIYSPPEQLLKQTHLINIQSDIYSTGITLFETLTRKRAFEHKNPEFALNLQLTYPLKNDYSINKELFRIIEKATAKEPFRLPPSHLNADEIEQILKKGQELRYKNCTEFIVALKLDAPLKSSWFKTFIKSISQNS